MSNKYETPTGPPPQYPDAAHTQQHYDAGPHGQAGALGPVAQQPYYQGQYLPQGAQGEYYGQQQQYPPYGGAPPQGYYGYPNQTQGMYYQQPYGPAPQGHFADGRGGGHGALAGGLCATLLAAMACCCCLDFMF